jgi:hypothetical protein
MPLSRDKKDFLVRHLGQKWVDELEGKIARLSKQLEREGIGFKDLSLDDIDRRLGLTDPAPESLDEWDDPIYEDLDKLNPSGERNLDQKELSAVEEFAQALEDDPAGVYLADLARYGAVKQ